MRASIVLSPVSTGKIGNEAANDGDLTTLDDRTALGRLLAIDWGGKRVGIAVSDELQMTVRPVIILERSSWKNLLRQIAEQVEAFDARAIVLGLPLNLDGSEGPAAAEARQVAAKLELSLKIPVHLQDERLTSEEAKSRFRDIQDQRAKDIDAAAAAIILEDFMGRQQ